jgi:hypothetical protein
LVSNDAKSRIDKMSNNKELKKVIAELGKLIADHKLMVADHSALTATHLKLVQEFRKKVGLLYFIDTHKN